MVGNIFVLESRGARRVEFTPLALLMGKLITVKASLVSLFFLGGGVQGGNARWKLQTKLLH